MIFCISAGWPDASFDCSLQGSRGGCVPPDGSRGRQGSQGQCEHIMMQLCYHIHVCVCAISKESMYVGSFRFVNYTIGAFYSVGMVSEGQELGKSM